jgi:hypothetical protein
MSENPLLRECLDDPHVIAIVTVSVIRCAWLDYVSQGFVFQNSKHGLLISVWI